MLGSPRLRTHRGQPVTAVITMSLAELEECTGHASTASGGTLPIKDALRMAHRSHPVLVLFDHDGRPLHLGRESRLATAEQRLALFATERGCSKPGCMVPADQCQVHHTVEWNRGGRSNIDELTLACAGDHAQVNTGSNGWTTVIGGDPEYPGACAWMAPSHLRGEQRARVNHAHHPAEFRDRGRYRRRSVARSSRTRGPAEEVPP